VSPKLSGGACKWNNGSAVPQNKIPVAIVVHKVIANHRHLINSGIAVFPPIVILPIGEK